MEIKTGTVLATKTVPDLIAIDTCNKAIRVRAR